MDTTRSRCSLQRTDPASSLRSLLNDSTPNKHNLKIELGDPKNINKNPVIESAIEELHSILRREQPHGGKINNTRLAQAISKMNSTIRHNKLSATEAWTKRNMSTGAQLEVNDKDLINMKFSQRCNNHQASATSKAKGKSESTYPPVSVGQLVMIYSDYSKLAARDKYLVTHVENDHIWVQKFTGNQFRGRSYRIKRSDVITVMNSDEVHQGSDSEEEDQTEPNQIDTMPETKYKNTTNQHAQQFVSQNDESDYSEDSDYDDYSEDSDYDENSVLRMLLPNKPLENESIVDANPTQELVEQTNLEDIQPLNHQSAHATRRNDVRRAPAYLKDYVTDVSALIEDVSDEETDEVRLQRSNTSFNNDEDINELSVNHLESITNDNTTDEEKDNNDVQEDSVAAMNTVVSEPTTKTNVGSTVNHADEAKTITVQTRSSREKAKSRSDSTSNLLTADQPKTPEGFGVVTVPKRSGRVGKRMKKQ